MSNIVHRGINLRKSELFGNHEGVEFNDSTEFLNQMFFPTAIKVWYGDVIDAIEIVYGEDYEDTRKSPFFHGGPNGDLSYFDMIPGDTIRKISGYYAIYQYSLDATQRKKVLVKLQFETRLGYKSREFGNSYGKPMPADAVPFSFDAGERGVVCALYGCTGKENLVSCCYIRGIGALVYDVPE